MKKQHIKAVLCTCIIGIVLLCGYIVYISGSRVRLIRALDVEEKSSEANTVEAETYIVKDNAIDIKNDEDIINTKDDEVTASKNGEDIINSEEDNLTGKSVAEIKNIVSIDGVYYVLDINGMVWKWNEDETKEEAKPVAGMENVVKIMDAGGAVYALTEDGAVFAWGSNKYYMIDSKRSNKKVYDEPVRVSRLNDIEDIDAGEGSAFAIDTSGRLLLWRKERFVLGEKKQPEYLEVEDNPELTENVKSIFMGAMGDESFHYFIREDGSVFSIMDTEYDGVAHYIFPTFRDEYIHHWMDNPAVNDLRTSHDEYYCLYEMGANNDIILLSADMYTMYMYKSDNTLWYWNSDRITYHDYPRAGAKVDTMDLDYNGCFEQVDIGDIAGIEADSEEELRIISICPCKENVLFLLNNGQIFASEYVTTEIKDVEFYDVGNTNPYRYSETDVYHQMYLKGISFYKLDYENIVSISSDKDSNFYLADKSGKIIHYIAESEE